MLTNANNDIFRTSDNGRLPMLASEIFMSDITRQGTNIYLLDTRRYYGDYRIAQPADGQNIATFIGGSIPLDVAGVSTFNQTVGTNLPKFYRNIDGFPAIYSYHSGGLNQGVINSSTLNMTNSASSLTAFYRLKMTEYTDSCFIFKIGNNQAVNARLSFVFYAIGNQTLVGFSNLDGIVTQHYAVVADTNSFINKWTVWIIDMNYVTRILRVWANGKLIFSQTMTVISSGALPNTNNNDIEVLGSTILKWKGYCSFARLNKNGTITNDDALKLTNSIENATLIN